MASTIVSWSDVIAVRAGRAHQHCWLPIDCPSLPQRHRQHWRWMVHQHEQHGAAERRQEVGHSCEQTQCGKSEPPGASREGQSGESIEKDRSECGRVLVEAWGTRTSKLGCRTGSDSELSCTRLRHV